MSSQDYPSRSRWVKRVDQIGELDISDRRRVGECVLTIELAGLPSLELGIVGVVRLAFSSCQPRPANTEEM